MKIILELVPNDQPNADGERQTVELNPEQLETLSRLPPGRIVPYYDYLNLWFATPFGKHVVGVERDLSEP